MTNDVDVRFKILVEINWITPAKGMEEINNRNHREIIIKKEAHELARRMSKELDQLKSKWTKTAENKEEMK